MFTLFHVCHVCHMERKNEPLVRYSEINLEEIKHYRLIIRCHTDVVLSNLIRGGITSYKFNKGSETTTTLFLGTYLRKSL